jgi:hypothetical protein
MSRIWVWEKRYFGFLSLTVRLLVVIRKHHRKHPERRCIQQVSDIVSVIFSLTLNNPIRYSRERISLSLIETGDADSVQAPGTEEHYIYAEQMNTEQLQKPEL